MENFYVKDIIEATGGRLLCGDAGTEVRTMSTNSGEIGCKCLFVPIIGEHTDAHRFIDSAVDAGAVAVLTSEHDSLNLSAAAIRVDDTVRAMQEIGRAYGMTVNIPKIGITGSVGKTTTKEMVACALGAGFKVFKTSGNNNSQVGVPNTLSRLSKSDGIAVIEMGMSMPGEMKRLAELVTLDCAVVTNIGVSHIEALGSRDGICREKFHIADALTDDGCMFLNGDDDILKENKKNLKKPVITFGIDEGNDFRAVNIKKTAMGTEYDIEKSGHVICHQVLNVAGVHNVRNGLVAVAVADRYGIEPQKASEALESYGGVAMRQQITSIKGITIIDDSYNASPDSMKAGVDVLCSVPCSGRRIAVLADMMELGDRSPEYHRQVGEFIKGMRVDELVLVGSLASYIGEGAKPSGIRIIKTDSREETDEYLRNTVMPGDAVLFKGSRVMELNKCADALKKSLEEA